MLCYAPWTAHSLMQNLKLTFDFERTVQLRRITIKSKNIETVSAMGNDGASISRTVGCRLSLQKGPRKSVKIKELFLYLYNFVKIKEFEGWFQYKCWGLCRFMLIFSFFVRFHFEMSLSKSKREKYHLDRKSKFDVLQAINEIGPKPGAKNGRAES